MGWNLMAEAQGNRSHTPDRNRPGACQRLAYLRGAVPPLVYALAVVDESVDSTSICCTIDTRLLSQRATWTNSERLS